MNTESEMIQCYIEEIRVLREALKYSKGTYYAELVKELAVNGKCPICGTKNLQDRKDTVRRQEVRSVASESTHETTKIPA